jgi:hypothetical protein
LLKAMDHTHIFTKGGELTSKRTANELQITPPRPMRVEDPKKDLEAMFQELVGGQHRMQLGTVPPQSNLEERGPFVRRASGKRQANVP